MGEPGPAAGRRGVRPRTWQLLVCAAGRGGRVPNLPPGLLVCGRPPGHEPPHRDAVWPVEWRDSEREEGQP